jgi:hypothetical protein
MSLGLWIIATQLAPAPPTVNGPQFNDVIDFFCRQHLASAALMTGLPATLSALRLTRRL